MSCVHSTTAIPLLCKKQELSMRDVIVNVTTCALEQKTGILVRDLIYLDSVMKRAAGKASDQNENSIDRLVDRIVDLVENGKGLAIAGLKDVPFPFMKSGGQFVTPASDDDFHIMSSNDIQKFIKKFVLLQMRQVDVGDLDPSLFEYVRSCTASKSEHDGYNHLTIPASNDVILVSCSNYRQDDMHEQHHANKVLFNLSSQIVTSSTSTSKLRVEAAFTMMKLLQEAHSNAHFMSKWVQDDSSVLWKPLSFEQIAEFCLIFAFEVFLEKQIDGVTLKKDQHSKSKQEESVENNNSAPIREPTEYDVLFGRGGMTNW
jgi:hypothetical protein